MPTVTETVREIALNHPSSIRVFEQFGIDYCCGGRKPLAIACTEQDVEVGTVLAALADAASESSPALTDWSKASLESLAGHIVSQHHEYVKKELPRLDTLAKKVVAAHGTNHAELPRHSIRIAGAGSGVDPASDERRTDPVSLHRPVGARPGHRQRETAQLLRNGRQPHCHDDAGTRRRRRTAGGDQAAQRQLHSAPDACPTYHAFYAGLKEFEQDLHQHIHLENNILFPRAIAMEAR